MSEQTMFERIYAIPLPQIIIFISIFFLSIRFLYDLIILIAFSRKQKYQTSKSNEIPVSIVICAKNEGENLRKHLPLICEQNYSNYEVVVVNDGSEDDSLRVLMEFDQKYSHFKYTHIPKDEKFEHGKKLALTIGIKAAEHDNILLTDADCIPLSKNWIKEMAVRLAHKQIVLGYGGYNTEKGLLNKIIRFDTVQIARNYLGLARLGMPYMGVGRNLAWQRSVYQTVNGFKSHYHLKSGDDDLLVNQAARRKNTTVCIKPEAFTTSVPEANFRNWFLQKRRHLTAGTKYRFFHKIILALDSFLKLLTWPFFALALIYGQTFTPFVYIFVGTFIVWHLFSWKIIMNKLKEKGFMLLIPFFEVFISILPFIILTKNFIQRKQSQWK
jgi:cellulose synthase/poly-beta-1,6-N-acetylglucosamine synthase-like glycosyltransferase